MGSSTAGRHHRAAAASERAPAAATSAALLPGRSARRRDRAGDADPRRERAQINVRCVRQHRNRADQQDATPAPPAQSSTLDDDSIADFCIRNNFDPTFCGDSLFEMTELQDHHIVDAWVPTPSLSPSEMMLMSLAESGLRRRCSARPCDCSADARELLKVRQSLDAG